MFYSSGRGGMSFFSDLFGEWAGRPSVPGSVMGVVFGVAVVGVPVGSGGG